MKIFDAHNDYFTSKYCNIIPDFSTNVLVNFAVWGTKISREEALEICDRIRRAGMLYSIEDASKLCFDDVAHVNPVWCSLGWNEDNALCGGAHGENVGLSISGKSWQKLLENTGILLDTAHLSPESLHDALVGARRPIVNSHSCVYELCSNPRNVRLHDIGEILNNGGFWGVCLYQDFLTNECHAATAKDVAMHLDCVVQSFGIKGVGIGTDYYGCDRLPTSLDNYQKFGNLQKELFALGYSKDDVEMIFYKNLVMFLQENRRGIFTKDFA